MAEQVEGKKISALPENTTMNDTDNIIMETAEPKTGRISFLNFCKAVAAKMASVTVSALGTTSKTIVEAINELNSNLESNSNDIADIKKELTESNYYETASDYYYINGGIGFYKYGKFVMAQAIDCSIKVEPGKTFTTIAYIDAGYRPAVDTTALLSYSGLTCCGLIKFKTDGQVQVRINDNISVKSLYIWFNAVYACYE